MGAGIPGGSEPKAGRANTAAQKSNGSFQALAQPGPCNEKEVKGVTPAQEMGSGWGETPGEGEQEGQRAERSQARGPEGGVGVKVTIPQSGISGLQLLLVQHPCWSHCAGGQDGPPVAPKGHGEQDDRGDRGRKQGQL